MLEFLQRLFIGHAHRWEVINEDVYEVERPTIAGKSEYELRVYTLQCKTCGNIKRERISPVG